MGPVVRFRAVGPEANVLAEIIDRIEVGRGYSVRGKFKLTARQFIEPDAGGKQDQKAS